MDPYSDYSNLLAKYEYIEQQRNNYINITNEKNESIKSFAGHLFSKSIDNLSHDMVGILFDESMEIVDVASALIELFIIGIDQLSRKSLFDLKTSYDDILFNLNKYFNSIEIEIKVDEVFDFTENINLYRDKNDYYCHITAKPPPFLCSDGWYLNDYRLIINSYFIFNDKTPLDKFVAFFINHEKKIFRIHFEFKPNI